MPKIHSSRRKRDCVWTQAPLHREQRSDSKSKVLKDCEFYWCMFSLLSFMPVSWWIRCQSHEMSPSRPKWRNWLFYRFTVFLALVARFQGFYAGLALSVSLERYQGLSKLNRVVAQSLGNYSRLHLFKRFAITPAWPCYHWLWLTGQSVVNDSWERKMFLASRVLVRFLFREITEKRGCISCFNGLPSQTIGREHSVLRPLQ